MCLKLLNTSDLQRNEPLVRVTIIIIVVVAVVVPGGGGERGGKGGKEGKWREPTETTVVS